MTRKWHRLILSLIVLCLAPGSSTWSHAQEGLSTKLPPGDSADAIRQRIMGKVERVKRALQQLASNGRDPSPFVKRMEEKVKPLFDNGNPLDGEAALDRILEELGGDQVLTGDEYRAFQNPERVAVRGYDGEVVDPFISRDGRYLFFNTTHFDPSKTALYYADRIDDLKFIYQGQIGGVNIDGQLTAVSSMDRDGNFYFVSPRSHAGKLATIHRGKFKDGVVSDIQAIQGLNFPGQISFDVEISADGNTLLFVDAVMSQDKTPGAGPKSADLAVAVKDRDGFKRRKNSAEILAKVNTPENLEYGACTSPDGLELFFDRFTVSEKSFGIWRAVRSTTDASFGTPQRLSAVSGFVEAQTLSPDGRSLYYQKREGDRFEFYRVVRDAKDVPVKK